MSRSRHERSAKIDFPTDIPIPTVTAVAIEDLGDKNAGIYYARTEDSEFEGMTSNQSESAPRSRQWPSKLRKAVTRSFKRGPNERMTRQYLSDHHWPNGLVEAFLSSIQKVPIRFFIIDDSGSMSANDGLKLLGEGKQQK
jgi:hypothetical protein